jgi:hypothetical protein
MMELTFYLIKQTDIKIIVNACQIVLDYLLHINNAKGEVEEKKRVTEQIFEQIMPVFEQKYLMALDDKIRVSKFDTSMANYQEEYFSRLRGLFNKLMGIFLKTDAIAEVFAQRIIVIIQTMRQQSDNSIILRYIEFVYRCIDILMNHSILFNHSSRHN